MGTSPSLQTSSYGSWFALCVVGVGEEALKLLAVIVTAYRHRAFNEPLDGIIYSVSTSSDPRLLKTSSIRSVTALRVAPVRAVITLAHASFGGGRLLSGPCPPQLVHRLGFSLRGVGIAALLHGVRLLIAGLAHPLVALIIIAFTYRFVSQKIRQLQQRRTLR